MTERLESTWDPSTLGVYELLQAGSKFMDFYDEEAAVQHFLRMRPWASAAKVRAELQAEKVKHLGVKPTLKKPPPLRTTLSRP